jgi:hypothetical protein
MVSLRVFRIGLVATGIGVIIVGIGFINSPLESEIIQKKRDKKIKQLLNNGNK